MYTSIFAPRTLPHARFFVNFEFGLMTLMLLLFTRVGLPPILVGLPEEYLMGTQGDGTSLQMIYYLCYCIVAGLILRYIVPVASLLFVRPTMLIFVSYILLLSLSSSVLSYALATSIEYAFATMLGAYLAMRFTYEEFTRMLCYTFIGVLGLSLLFAVFLPHIGWQAVGDGHVLRGAFQNRNMLAYYMSMGAPLLLLYGLGNVSRQSAFFVGASIVGFICVYASQALTAKIIASVILFLIIGLSWAERSRLRHMLFIAFTVYLIIVMGTALTFYYDEILAFFGKSPTLTGRVAYYARALEEIMASPIVGTRGAPFYIQFLGNNIPTNAFSGHLNILMFYGLIGMSIYLMLMLHHFIGALRFLRDCPGTLRLWPLVFLGFWFFGNITESATLGAFFWALFSAHLIGFRTWYAQSST